MCERECPGWASSTVLVMLRQTVSGWVYFWVSDSVSMAADASERKALRYKQTLVSVPLSFLLFFLSLLLLLSFCVHLSVSTSACLSHYFSVVCQHFLSPSHLCLSCMTHLCFQCKLHVHGCSLCNLLCVCVCVCVCL